MAPGSQAATADSDGAGTDAEESEGTSDADGEHAPRAIRLAARIPRAGSAARDLIGMAASTVHRAEAGACEVDQRGDREPILLAGLGRELDPRLLRDEPPH